jgi:hypothetical protein
MILPWCLPVCGISGIRYLMATESTEEHGKTILAKAQRSPRKILIRFYSNSSYFAIFASWRDKLQRL